MGSRGPIPNRSEDLARPRERNGEARNQGDITHGTMRTVRIPHPDKDWHPIATQLYKAARSSGQADFYQNSDWAVLYSICDDLSFYKKSGKRSSQMAATIYAALTTLLVTEGDRRRARLELQHDAPDTQSAELYAIDGYKAALEEGD